MNNLTKFLSHRIAEEEVRHHAVLADNPGAWSRELADRWLSECISRRWTLKFHEQVSRSGEPGADTAWAALNIVLMNMAHQYRGHPDFDPTWAAEEAIISA